MDKITLLTSLNKELIIELDVMEKKVTDLKKKINQEGISIYHSINSDIFETAAKIHKISALLGYLKTFNLEFKEPENERS